MGADLTLQAGARADGDVRPELALTFTSQAGVFTLVGALDRHTVPLVHTALLEAVRTGERVVLDLAQLTRIDSAGSAMLAAVARTALGLGTTFTLGALSPVAAEALGGLRTRPVDADRAPSPDGLVARVGAWGHDAWRGGLTLGALVADTVFFTFGGARQTSRVRRGASWSAALQVGVDALPIVGLIAGLIGIVVALQSAAQLRDFGASIYVADLITVSMTREMGPLMTAIIIAGRSGAAIAAEIATMQVSQEVDALRTMGLEPVRYIVVPKFVAMTLTMPCLTLFASALGILGGWAVALLFLDLASAAYWRQVQDAVALGDLLLGSMKAVVFAWIIVLVAAHRGFQARGGAESVGRVTTASVVSAVFWVIVADASFSLLLDFSG